MEGSTNMGILDMTTGVSADGLEKYMNELKTISLKEVCNNIDDVQELINQINNCWQGESRDRFLQKFAEVRENIKNDLNSEYSNLESKLQSLFAEMRYIDQKGIYDAN